ncbi:spore germination protein [Heyndrickxia ginsengihumi]|uniref:Spore germination protein n=1 Tax=Heyndrickxia ginsengihumi TaxID=363870 RepID=A0A6M0PBJ2_9BACI|nr:spore germination protein [Heyndrickxia ginsengihumi]MBE6184607.1 spore germination protein [Bacillus sp. (in: firmicutes)]MCM3022874.1 spore germination protein [Heyndrickxia ginsengihumi]NEY20698.1 spore germination protein [Heyndrickxia ginsengihumi]
MNQKTPIPSQLDDLEELWKKRVGLGTSYDVGVRKLKILRKDVHLYYLNGLNDSISVSRVITELVNLNDTEKQTIKVFELVQNRIVNQQMELVKTFDELVDQVLSGLIGIVVEGQQQAIIVDVRSYPGRMPMEPDTEKVVRGSRDGYVENIVINTALTRRRIRDERLRIEMKKAGERSKTDIAIAYIDGIADPDTVNLIKKEIEEIEIDGVTMADKTVEEFIFHQGYNPFPLSRYTERPDVAATHLLEGHVLIIVDTSPSVIIAPTTIFHHMQHAEEYREASSVGTFIRWIRYMGIFVSLFLLPLWYIYVAEPSLLPEKLDYIGPNKHAHVPIIVQLFIADLGIECMRVAAIHTPTPLATAMGIIAAVMIGQIAVAVGLFVSEVILYVAASALGTFVTPSYELSVANRIIRLVLLFFVAFFGVKGFVLGTTVFILYLVSIKALNAPYCWPIIPFNPKACLQVIFRRSVPGQFMRPSITNPIDRFRQPPDNA